MRSPAQNAYRNNVEFSIGFSPDGKPTVGYLYGRFADGFTEIADPRSMSNISAVGKGYAALLTAFLRSEHSNLAAWNKADTVGPVRGACADWPAPSLPSGSHTYCVQRASPCRSVRCTALTRK